MTDKEFDYVMQKLDVPLMLVSAITLLFPLKLFAQRSPTIVAIALTAVALLVVIDRRVSSMEMIRRVDAGKSYGATRIRLLRFFTRILASVAVGGFSAYVMLVVFGKI
jgi:hypothetical protein